MPTQAVTLLMLPDFSTGLLNPKQAGVWRPPPRSFFVLALSFLTLLSPWNFVTFNET